MRFDDSIHYLDKNGRRVRYKIYKDSTTNKFGIRDIDKDITVVKCVFDMIAYSYQMDLFLFTLNGKQAFCRIEQITKLRFSRR